MWSLGQSSTLHLSFPPHVWSSPVCFLIDFTDTDLVSPPTGPGNSMLWPHICMLAGAWPLLQLHLSWHSKVLQDIQQSTHKVYRHAQHTFLHFCHCYNLLPVPANQETLLYFATFLADAKGLRHSKFLSYLHGVWALHIDMGLSDPLKGAFQLHKCPWAIHIQSNQVSCKLAFMYKLLALACPLHKFPHRKYYGLPWPWPTLVSFGWVNSQWIMKALTQHSTYVFRMWLLALPPRQR